MEGLINFRKGASGNGLSVGSFGGGVFSHGGIEGEDFWLFLHRSWGALAAQSIFWTGAFFYSQVAAVEVSVGTRVSGRRLWGMGGGGHC